MEMTRDLARELLPPTRLFGIPIRLLRVGCYPRGPIGTSVDWDDLGRRRPRTTQDLGPRT